MDHQLSAIDLNAILIFVFIAIVTSSTIFLTSH